MKVSRTIRYEGSYREALELKRMLEQQGIHAELPQEELERAQREAQEREELEAQQAWERREREARVDEGQT